MAYTLRFYRRSPIDSTLNYKRLPGTRGLCSIVAGLILGTLLPNIAAAYSSMCASDASDLETAARNYEAAKSHFELAQSNFESACGPFGFSRKDELACGQFGYTREEYRHAARSLDYAKSPFNSARTAVASSCNVPEEASMYIRAFSKMKQENEVLRRRVRELEEGTKHPDHGQTHAGESLLEDK